MLLHQQALSDKTGADVTCVCWVVQLSSPTGGTSAPNALALRVPAPATVAQSGSAAAGSAVGANPDPTVARALSGALSSQDPLYRRLWAQFNRAAKNGETAEAAPLHLMHI